MEIAAMIRANTIRVAAIGTSICAATLLVLALATGGSQGLFQLYAHPDSYADLLRERGTALRWDIGIDLLFIAAYSSFIIMWSRWIIADGADRFLVNFALALVMMTALLDAIENAHILAMLRAAELGSQPSQGEILAQQVASQVKFQAAYFGMAGLGMLFRPRDGWGWVKALFFLQLIAGLAIFVTSGGVMKALYLFRALFFVAGPPLVLAASEALAEGTEQTER
jgi:hypothetical protein